MESQFVEPATSSYNAPISETPVDQTGATPIDNSNPLLESPTTFAGAGTFDVADDLYEASPGHHWVAKAPVNANSGLMTPAARQVFAQGTSGALPYDHEADTWLKVTHDAYNDAMNEVLKTYAGQLPDNRITGKNAQEFLSWISEGNVATKNPTLYNASKDAFDKVILPWRKGFLQSESVAFAAAQANSKLSRAELKAIAKAAVNGEEAALTSSAMRKVYSTLRGSRGLVSAAAKKVIPGLLVYQIASSTQRGYTQGVNGYTGFVGAGLQNARDLVFADLVESTAFPAIHEVADAIESGLTKGQGFGGLSRNRLGDGGFNANGLPLNRLRN